MTIPLSEVVNSVDGLKALLDCKLPIKVSYRISKLVNHQIERELKNFNEARNKLIQEFGTENEDQTVSVKPEKMADYIAKLNELLSEQIELDWEPIAIDSFGDAQIEPKNLPNFLVS